MRNVIITFICVLLLSACKQDRSINMAKVEKGKLQETKVVLHYAIYTNRRNISDEFFSEYAKRNNLNRVQTNTEEENTVFIEIIENANETNPIVPAESLKYFVKGISEADYPNVYQKDRAIHVVLSYNPTTSIELYKSLILLLGNISCEVDGFIWDDESRLLYTTQYWMENVLPAFHDVSPEIRQHISIHQYQQDDGSIRSITLGFRKFGLPDLVIQQSPRYLSPQNGNILTLIGQLFIENPNLQFEGKMNIDISNLKSTREKEIQGTSIIADGKGNGDILFETTKIEQGDPQNRLFSIFYRSYSRNVQFENQTSFYSQFYGSSDSVVGIKHEDELLVASSNAKTKFAGYYEAFKTGLKPGESLLVKAPFLTKTGSNEWMWVEIVKWEEDIIEGILQNDPYEVPKLKAGSIVKVKQSDIFDYIYYKSDGSYEGNETGKIIEEMNK